MSDTTNYRLTIINGSTDPEFLMFKLFKSVPEAKNYFDEDGGSSGNDYDWRSLDDNGPQTLRAFSATVPDALFMVTEYGTYDNESFEYRHYFKAGKYARIKPEVQVTWPEFSEGMLV